MPSCNPAGGKRSYWTVLPLSKSLMFGDPAKYVNNGIYQLPLIEGSVSKSILNCADPMKALIEAFSVGKSDKNHIRLADSCSSIIVAVQNPLLSTLLRTQTSEYAFGIIPSSAAIDIPTRERLVSLNLNVNYTSKFVSAAEISEGPIYTDVLTRNIKFQYDYQKYSNVKKLSELLSRVSDLKKLGKEINKSFAHFAGFPSSTV